MNEKMLKMNIYRTNDFIYALNQPDVNQKAKDIVSQIKDIIEKQHLSDYEYFILLHYIQKEILN